MPYLHNDDRVKFKDILTQLDGGISGAEMNYLISSIIASHVVKHGESYGYYQEMIGALEACKLELYRRMVAPYEDIKIGNGDVYPRRVNEKE